jgi:hypothetical protein
LSGLLIVVPMIMIDMYYNVDTGSDEVSGDFTRIDCEA